MDRRRFLALITRLAGALALLPGGRLLAGEAAEGATGDAAAAADLPDLVVAKGDAVEATRRAIAALGGMERFVQPGMVVVVKPNASFPRRPELGATTHPGVLSAVLEACFQAWMKRTRRES